MKIGFEILFMIKSYLTFTNILSRTNYIFQKNPRSVGRRCIELHPQVMRTLSQFVHREFEFKFDILLV